MARYLGDAAGRASKQYIDSQVANSCTNLCTYVNTVCSNLDSSKLSTTGDGSGLSGVVTQLTAGTGISVNQSTGAITISTSGGADGAPEILYNCACCWNGSFCIPSSKQGAFTHYEILGYYKYHQYYCSSTAICFTPWPGCAQSPASGYCCHQCSCGWVGINKCNNGTNKYDCAGNISWTLGCESGCRTACNCHGAIWHARISPVNACAGECKAFWYCFNTSNNGDSAPCCIGGRNAGLAYNCCGQFPACLRCWCQTTQSGSRPFTCNASVVVLGFGRLT